MPREIPWWAKTLVYVGVPVGILALIYKGLEMWMKGPLDELRKLWERQYEEYVKELKAYSEQSKGALTQEQLSILRGKEASIKQTEQAYAQQAARLGETFEWWVKAITAGGFAIASLYFLPKVVERWRGLVREVRTEVGQAYLANVMCVDDLAARGRVAEAAALNAVISSQYREVDQPYMISQVSYLQAQLPYLTGWEAMYASYAIAGYQLCLSQIPVWLTYLPPLPI
jgi:hypothetical protein